MTRFGNYNFNENFEKLPGKIIILENLDVLSSNRVRFRQTRSIRPIEFRVLNLTIDDYKEIQKVIILYFRKTITVHLTNILRVK